jgi:hypothetical protein
VFDPVLILAPPRSFTSVVCGMLGQHPQLYGLPEVNLFVAETMAERAGFIAVPRWSEHGLLRAVAELFGGAQTPQTVALAERWLEIRANCSCVSVFRELAERVSPRVLVEKSPRSVMSVEYLYRAVQAFPETRFIHLLRHPRTQGESLWKLGGELAARNMRGLDYGTDPPTVDFQKAWYSMNVNILTFLAGLPEEQQLQIRGEQIMRDPATHLREIAGWLGLRTDDQAVEAMLHPERSPFACVGPVGAALGNDPSFLREPALRPIKSDSQEPSLDGPLPWREDGGEFSDEVRELAMEFGYQ